MKPKFMLIDDSIIDLYINEKNIEKLEIDSDVTSYSNGISALEFFKKLDDKNNKQNGTIPDIILLDINMPKMNGFQFSNAFKKLDIAKKKNIQIFMLSASNNSKFIADAKSGKYCHGFIEKPLNTAKLNSILKTIRPYLNEDDFKGNEVNQEVIR